MTTRNRYESYQLDTASRRLEGPTGDVSLRGHAMDLLALLVRHAPDTVSQETIRAEVWGREALSDSSIPQAVRDIRAALGDDARRPRFVATRYARGYQFVAPVEAVDDGAPEQVQTSREAARAPAWKPVTVAAVVLLVIAAAMLVREPPTLSTSEIEVPVALAPGDGEFSEALARYLEFVVNATAGGNRLEVSRDADTTAVTRAVPVSLSTADTGDSRSFELRLGQESQPRTVPATEMTTLISAALDVLDDEAPLSGTVSVDGILEEARAAGLVSSSSYATETVLRGMVAQLAGERERAAQLFEVALDEDPEFDIARYELAIAVRALGDYERALSLLDMLALEQRSAFWTYRLGNAAGIAHWRLGDYDSAIASYRKALAAAERDAHRATISVNLALLLRDQGQVPEARKLAAEATRLSEKTGNERLLASALNTLASIDMRLGEHEAALVSLDRARELFYALGAQESYAAVLSRTAGVRERLGEYEQAEALLRLVLETRRRLGQALDVAATELRLAALARERGDFSEARTLARRGLDGAFEESNSRLIVLGHRELARTARAQGLADEASGYANEGLRLARSSAEPALELALQGLVADIAIDQAPAATETAAAVEATDELAEEVGERPGRTESLLQHARWRESLGDLNAARADLSSARELARSGDDAVREKRALLALARLALDAEPAQASEYLDAAERLRPRPYPYLFLRARYLAKTGNAREAVAQALEARNRAGDWWTEEDEQELARLESALGERSAD